MAARIPWLVLMLVALVVGVSSCDYVRLLRPSVLSQLNPRVVSLVNYLPEVDDPNEAMLARLFVHGGLSHAELGSDGVFRDEIFIPKNEFIWQPAVIVMDQGGELELTFSNCHRNPGWLLEPGDQRGDPRRLFFPRRCAS